LWLGLEKLIGEALVVPFGVIVDDKALEGCP
jgi:hypothetical protein